MYYLLILLSSAVIFLSACSNWKNRVVPPVPLSPYAFRGDTIDQWSLIRLDSVGGSWGYVSADGKRAIQPLFEWADDFADRMALVREQEHYTYINQEGKQMRRIKASHAYAFSEGLAAVQKSNKWGYIDRRGKWIIKPRFDWAMPFSQNRAAVAFGDQYGFINRQGELMITPQYEDAKPFVNHLSIVRKNGKYGLIDTLGREILPVLYRRIEPWEKDTYKLHVADKKMGVANADGQPILDTLYTSITIVRDDFLRVTHPPHRFVGLFDFKGREILPPAYTFLGFVSDEGFLAAMKDGKFGVVDTAGNTLLPFHYADGHIGFAEGRIAVYSGVAAGHQDAKTLLMDTAFQLINELPYPHAYPFSNGFAIVEQVDDSSSYNKRYGYINRKGEEVIPPQYDSAYGFNEHGLAIVGLREWGITGKFLIDTVGKQLPLDFAIDHLGNRTPIFQPRYNNRPSSMHSLKPFGYRLFYNKSGSDFTFLSPETGLMMDHSTFPYQSLSPLNYSDRNDLATVRIDSLAGLIDTTLTELLAVHYEDIRPYIRDRIAIKKNGKWGFADAQFRFRIPFSYDQVSSFRYGYAKVENDKQNGIIDPRGRMIIPLRYENTTVDSVSNRIYAQREQGHDIYDLYGRLLFSSPYSHIAGFWGETYSTFRQGDKMGVLADDFSIICEPMYDRIGPVHEGRAWVMDGTKVGIVDSSFQLVIPLEYDVIEDYALGFTRVEKDDESFYIDRHGKRIQPSEEDIEKRKEVIEKRREGFIDFSS